MSGWHRVYYTLLNLSLNLLVRSKAIPADPHIETALDLCQLMTYGLPYDSKTDLLTLRMQCLKQKFPDPLVPLNIDGVTLPRYVFIHDDGPCILTWYSEKSRSVTLFHNYLNLHHSNLSLDV